MKQKINQYLYYILIAIVSVIGVFVMPLIGSDIDLALAFPNTVGGWIVYVGGNLISAIGNMLIFFGFMEQAKVNVANDPHYIEANQILLDLALRREHKEKLPKSPKQWKAQEYGKKGTTLFLGSLFSCIALTNAILRFDLMVMIGYIITTTFAVIFGLFQMRHAQGYWTDEFYQYAVYEKKKFDAAQTQTEVKNDN